MTSTKMIAMLAVGGLLALAPALIAADTNTPPASTPPTGGPPGGFRGGMRGGPTIEQLTTNLSLTADQIPKVKTVLDDQKKKMTDLMQDSSLSREDRRTKMQDLRKDMSAKMKEILTDDQFAKFEKMRPPGGRRPGGGGGDNGAPPAGAPPQN
jgi:periplasmic protein CpxP/Spy